MTNCFDEPPTAKRALIMHNKSALLLMSNPFILLFTDKFMLLSAKLDFFLNQAGSNCPKMKQKKLNAWSN
jgi:hypothetical protein